MTQHTLRVKQHKLSDLRQHPRNPRNGDVDLIAESLEVNGQFKPIVLANDGTILAGNHSYQAALSLGWETMAAVTLDLDPDSPEAVRVMLADNRTSDVGANMYDDRALLDLLEGLGDDLTGTGYKTYDLDDLMGEPDEPLPEFPEVDEDLETQYKCPSCSYEWSGKPKPASE